ncbi:MAG TPA: DNRLRE domain-containing protein, partial [Acidimicrobiia bacterium]|nr:DNRLRE domain-containing protein [Acidimicrobiia bacterium]
MFFRSSRPARPRAGAIGAALVAAVLATSLRPASLSPAGAATVSKTYNADADARVEQSNPSTNYGTSGTLTVDGNPVVESYVRFGVSGLSGTVTKATLRLYVTNGSSDGPAAFPAGSSWSESSVTWSNRPARTGPAAGDLGAVGNRRWVTIDVTPLVQGDGAVTFNLAGTDGDGTEFSSREAKKNRPRLVVETGGTSEPPPPPPAGTVTLAPDADAKVAEASPSTNYGNATTLEVDNSPLLESFIRFPVSGVDGLVSRAVVRLYVTNASTNGPAIYPSATGWSESTITWANRPLRTGVAADDKGSISKGGYTEFDVTGIVAGNGLYSFSLVGTSSDGTDFSSSEASSNRPQLAVEFETGSTDTTPPETTITSGPSGTADSGAATFAFTSSEAGSTFQCRLDGSTFAG